MIEAVDGVSLVLWAVTFLAAGMYPLGLLLPCSPCCKVDCDEPIEFYRCIRFESPSITTLATQYDNVSDVEMPLHGYSKSVSRPEDVGAARVPTNVTISGNAVRIMPYARRMSDGETQTASYRLQIGAFQDYGTAARFDVTLAGVTIPYLDAAQFARNDTFSRVHATKNNPIISAIPRYMIGSATDSINATKNVSVFDAFVESGSRMLDGSVVTRDSLKECITASLSEENGVAYCTLSLQIPLEFFTYVEATSTVVFRWVIRHVRGSTSTYSTYTATVNSLLLASDVIPMPPGVQPPSWEPLLYSNSTLPPASPVYGEETGPNVIPVTVYSHSATATTIAVIQLREVTREIVGEERLGFVRETLLRHELYQYPLKWVYSPPSQYMEPAFDKGFPFYAATWKANSRAYIMKFIEPGPLGRRVADWNTDIESVLAFLQGELTLSVTLVAVTNLDAVTWNVRVSEGATFCGYPLEPQSIRNVPNLASGVLSDAIEKTVTATLGKLPPIQSITNNSGSVISTRANRCYGQDPSPVFSMRLYGSAYRGSWSSCVNLDSSVGFGDFGKPLGTPATQSRLLHMRSFYCGDLLWAIENGPCRQSLTITNGLSDALHHDQYVLGGDDFSPNRNRSQCVYGAGVDATGKCQPAEAVVTFSQTMGVGFDTQQQLPKGTIAAGDYVMTAYSGWIWALQDTNCNQEAWQFPFPVTPLADHPSYRTSYLMAVVRKRQSWCEEWSRPLLWASLGGPCDGIGHPLVNGTWQMGRGGGCGYLIGGSDTDVYLAFPGSVSYGQPSEPYDITVAPQESTIDANGGSVEITYCCPAVTVTEQFQASGYRYPRVIMASRNSNATAYIFQGGWDETGNECRFVVRWDFDNWNQNAGPGTAYVVMPAAGGCVHGQLDFGDGPKCSVDTTTENDWLTVDLVGGAMVRVTAKANDTAATRYGAVVIHAGETSQTWTIFQPL